MTDGFDRIAVAFPEPGVGMTTRTTGQKILIGIAVGVSIGVVVGGLGAFLGLPAGVRGGLTGALTVFALLYLLRRERRA
jgi:hypothetical protein